MKIKKSQLKELIRNSIREIVSEEDDGKYTHIGYGKYKEKGKEKDKSAPTFKKDDGGKFVPFKSEEPKSAPTPDKEKPKPKMTKIKADPFADKGRAADDEADDIDRDARFAADDDEPPFKGGKPSKDDTEYDVGGPSYPKVPKGVKTSADAKGVMKARDLAKQAMDIDPEIDKKAMSAADDANLKMQKDVTDSAAQDIGYDDAEDLIMGGEADEIAELVDHDDVYESIPEDLIDPFNNALDFIRDNEQGVRSDDEDRVNFYRKELLKMIQNPTGYGKKKEVKESIRRKYTIKEVRMWMKKLEENRYKKVYNSDARRVSWMVNHMGESLDNMPKSMKKKWTKAQYGRERYLAKEFLKSKSEQLAEQKLRKTIRRIIKEVSPADKFHKTIQRYQDKITKEKEKFRKSKERQQQDKERQKKQKTNEYVGAGKPIPRHKAKHLFVPENQMIRFSRVFKKLIQKGFVYVGDQTKEKKKISKHYTITVDKKMYDNLLDILMSKRFKVKT